MSAVRYKAIPTSDTDNELTEEISFVQDPIGSQENDPTIVSSSESNGKKCHYYKAYIYAAVSCLFFASGSTLVKLTKNSLKSQQLAFIRSFVQLIYCFVIVLVNRLSFWSCFQWKTRVFLTLRGICGSLAMLFYFFAFQNMPVGDASAIVFSSPIYTTLLACIFLKEPCGFVEIVALLISIVGVVLITKPVFIINILLNNNKNESMSMNFIVNSTNHSNFNYTNSLEVIDSNEMNYNLVLGTASAILGSMLASGSFICLRLISKVHYTIPIIYLSLFGIAFSSLWMLIQKSFPLPTSSVPWIYGILVGICGICGQVLLTKAFQSENAGPVSIVRQLDIVIAYIYQILIFHDSLSLSSSFGTLFVIGGSIITVLKKWWKTK